MWSNSGAGRYVRFMWNGGRGGDRKRGEVKRGKRSGDDGERER